MIDRRLIDDLMIGVVEALPEGALEAKLAAAEREGRPLRVKLGVDPTAPDIHLGHTVVLNKLRQFQDAGHVAVLIIGDYTARIGDPSGRSKSRPRLDGAIIDANAKTYQEQAFLILDSDPTKLEVRHNGEWLAPLTMEQLFELVSKGISEAEAVARFARGIALNAHRFIGEPAAFYLSGGMCENLLFRRSFPSNVEVRCLGRFVLVEGLLIELERNGYVAASGEHGHGS